MLFFNFYVEILPRLKSPHVKALPFIIQHQEQVPLVLYCVLTAVFLWKLAVNYASIYHIGFNPVS